MLIDDIDFARLYQQQLALAGRKRNRPPTGMPGGKHRHRRRPGYRQLSAAAAGKIDLHGASSLFDMGCGPGTVSLALASQLEEICGVDYSQGMLEVAARRATAQAFATRSGASGRGKRAGRGYRAAISPSPPVPPGGRFARCDDEARSSGAVAGLHHPSG